MCCFHVTLQREEPQEWLAVLDELHVYFTKLHLHSFPDRAQFSSIVPVLLLPCSFLLIFLFFCIY